MTFAQGDRTWKRALLTIGAMREAGVTVKAACVACGRRRDIDLENLEARRCPQATLVDHRPVCGGCGSSGHYLAHVCGETHDMLTVGAWNVPAICGWCGGANGQHQGRPWWLPELRRPLCQED